LPEHLREDIAAFREVFRRPASQAGSGYVSYATGVRPDVAELMTERIIRSTTLTGTARQVRACLTAMEEVGVGYVAIRPVVDISDTIRSFAEVARG
jgi:hypothetical protein